MKYVDKMLPIAFVIAFSFTISASATAQTLANVTGSGDLHIAVQGTAYLNANRLDQIDLTLRSAGDIILAGDAFPTGAPGRPKNRIELRAGTVTTRLSILGDVYFEEFDFAGRLTLLAGRIHVIGPTVMLGSRNSYVLTAGSGPSESSCFRSTAGIGLVSSTKSVGASDVLCGSGTLVTSGTGGGLAFADTGLTITAGVPEPSAALIFGIGIVSLAAWIRRR